MNLFKSILENLTPSDFNFSINGNEYVIIRNAQSAVGLCITMQESTDLIKMINKALTLTEAFEIIYSPKPICDE
jgi:hypothetical protein